MPEICTSCGGVFGSRVCIVVLLYCCFNPFSLELAAVAAGAVI